MNYAKAIAAVIAAAFSAVVVALTGDNTLSATEQVNVAIAVVGAASVFAAPNVPGARVTKFVLAFLMAVLTLAVNLIVGGVTVSEWLQLAIAGLGALGVYTIPNQTKAAI